MIFYVLNFFRFGIPYTTTSILIIKCLYIGCKNLYNLSYNETHKSLVPIQLLRYYEKNGHQ